MVPVRLLALVYWLFTCYQCKMAVTATVTGDQQQQETKLTTIAQASPQNLQSALYSIEERLRALDLVYVARSYAPRHQAWDGEQFVRRLDAIDARIGRVEALLEMRLDKIQETLSANELKRTLAGDQVQRKFESLYDRLDNRMAYAESRMDLDVAKIQSSIEGGFARVARADSEDLLESDVETQLQEVQRQLEVMETVQNATLARLADRLDESDEPEAVVDKVNKMVDEFSHRTQSMEGLVKNAMSLANATRRELQDGLKTLGLRLNFHGKHNKENVYDLGSDALATLITKEFANMGSRLAAGHDKMAATQQDFRLSCHRLQEKEQQLSDTVAKVLDGIIDLVHNRSLNIEKQMGTFQEVLKQHTSQITRTVSEASTTRQQQDSVGQLLARLQELGEQLSVTNATSRLSCLDHSSTSDKILTLVNEIHSDHFSRRSDVPCNAQDRHKCRTSKSTPGIPPSNTGRRDRVNVLDIVEEQHGETLHYNVTQGGNESEGRVAENGTDEEAERTSEQYDDDVDQDGVANVNEHEELKHNMDPEFQQKPPENVKLSPDELEEVNVTSEGDGEHSERNRTELERGDSDPNFSSFWHRIRHNGTSLDKNVPQKEDEKDVDDSFVSKNLDVKILDKAQFNENDNEYNNDYEE